LLWLLCWYAPRSSVQFQTLPLSPFLKAANARLRERPNYFHFPSTVTQHENIKHPIRQLFPPSLQQALIIWGFRASLLPNANLEQSLLGSTLAKRHYRRRLLHRQQLQRKHWSIGLRLVVLLRDLGVWVHHHTVAKALQMQFVVLFGRGRSKVKENRIMEDVNPIPYAQYVREVNTIWGAALFREPQLFGKGRVHEHTWHPRMRRYVDRPPSVSLDDVLGPDWQHQAGDAEQRRETGAVKVDNAPVLRELKRRFDAQERAGEYDARVETSGLLFPRITRRPKASPGEG
jgi:hypothetical protein